MEYTIRQIEQEEIYLLDEFLYEAIFIPEGMTPPPKTIIKQPELHVYVNGFGNQKAFCRDERKRKGRFCNERA